MYVSPQDFRGILCAHSVGQRGHEMSHFTVHLKTTSGGEKISIDVRNEMTIADVKSLVAEKANIAADNQRLIYKGQVLKDDRTVESYGASHTFPIY